VEAISNFIELIKHYSSIPLFTFGDNAITVWMLVYFLLLVLFLFFGTGKIKKWFVYRLLARTHLDIGVRLAIGTIVRYVLLVIGFMIILHFIGVDLSGLTIIASALGVGVGFGLQNITNNFVSGIIILFERPIKVGDRIEVGAVTGDVVKISMRSTTVLTNDNIAIIVPNSEFISSTVINWSHTDRNVRFNIPVGVSYKSDPEIVKKLLMEVAENNAGVLKDPVPDVLLSEYGDNSINFNLRVWTNEYITQPYVLKSQLYYSAFKKFKEHGIEIPFPQRDIHVKNDLINFHSE
jgi:small-conductance mechanosensitive channel